MITVQSFSDSFFENVLKEADDSRNVEMLILHLANGDTISATGSKRLCQVGLAGCFVDLVGSLNKAKNERQFYIPFDQIVSIEVVTPDLP